MSPLAGWGSSQYILPSSSDSSIWNPFPTLSLKVQALGTPQDLMGKGTYISVPRGCQVETSLPLPPAL